MSTQAQAPQQLLAAYAFVGTNEVKIQEALRRLKKRLKPEYLLFNYSEHEAKELQDPAAFVADLSQLPMGDSLRVVAVFHAETLSRDAQDALIAYLAHPNTSSVLFLSATKLAKNTRLYKAIYALNPHAIVDCGEPAPARAKEELARMAHSLHLNPDAAALDELLSRSGSNMLLLKNHLQALFAYLAAEEQILPDTQGAYRVDRDLVCARVARSDSEAPWKFLDALSERRLSDVLAHLAAMPDVSEILLFTLIQKRLRELMIYKALSTRTRGITPAQALKLPPWALNNYRRMVGKFDAFELERLYSLCLRLSCRSKSSSKTSSELLELVQAICTH